MVAQCFELLVKCMLYCSCDCPIHFFQLTFLILEVIKIQFLVTIPRDYQAGTRHCLVVLQILRADIKRNQWKSLTKGEFMF